VPNFSSKLKLKWDTESSIDMNRLFNKKFEFRMLQPNHTFPVSQIPFSFFALCSTVSRAFSWGSSMASCQSLSRLASSPLTSVLVQYAPTIFYVISLLRETRWRVLFSLESTSRTGSDGAISTFSCQPNHSNMFSTWARLQSTLSLTY
jgi:hypothetical protein